MRTVSRMALPLVAAFAAAAWAGPARACSICGCGDPLLAASDPAAITGQLRLQLDTEYLRVDAGTDGQPGFTDELTQWSYRLNAVYRPIDALSLTATLPFVSKRIQMVGPGIRETHSSLSGLGDAELGARYALWNTVDFGARRVQEFAISAGTMMPTGSHGATMTDPGTGEVMLIDAHGQLGTGGWGPFAGIHYRFEQGDWLGFASVSYRIRTQGSFSDGSKYKFGDAALWSIHGQYRPIPKVALDLGLDGRHAWADKATAPDGTVTDAVENTGGTVWSVAPGVYYNAAGKLWLFLRGQLPVYKNLFGEQDVKSSFTAGFQYQIL